MRVEALLEILAEPRDFAERVAAVALQKHLQLAAHHAHFHFLADVVEALLHQFHLQRVQLFRLHQDFFAHSYFSEIVQQRGVANFLHLLVIEMAGAVGTGGNLVHNFGQALGVSGHAQRMSGGCGIALLDRGHRGFHEAFEQAFEYRCRACDFRKPPPLAMPATKPGAPSVRGTAARARATSASLRKRAAGSFFALISCSTPSTSPLALRIGKREQRFCAVTRFAIVMIVEVKRHFRWDVIRIREVHYLAAQRGVARHGIFRHRQREFLERKHQAVVLRQHETQMPAALAFIFNQVERAGIRPRDFPGFGENQIEQLANVALRGESNPDFIQLFALAFGAFPALRAQCVRCAISSIFSNAIPSVFSNSSRGSVRGNKRENRLPLLCAV